MWISRTEYNELLERIGALERTNERQQDLNSELRREITTLYNCIGDVESETGLSIQFERGYGLDRLRKPLKPQLSLQKEIQKIMDHIGLKIEVTPKNVNMVKVTNKKVKKR